MVRFIADADQRAAVHCQIEPAWLGQKRHQVSRCFIPANDSDYKSSLPSQTDALLSDRGHIDSSHRMIDDTLK